MRYIEHQPGGGPDVLRLATGTTPTPGPRDVLIAVKAAGVNRPDIAQRNGSYPPPPDASPLLGLEVAGEIVAVGAEVTQWRKGDVVCALTPGGGYAEYCVAPAAHCLPIPEGLSLIEAASLPENYFTVWTNLIDRAHLRSGERLLVHGGSSGIGQAAIQLARWRGAQIYTTVGSSEKAAFCLAQGADVAYQYKETDWAAALWQDTAKRGVDVILDMVGGDYTMKNLRSLAFDGRLVNIAFLQGSKVPDFDAMLVMTRRLTFTGSTLRPRSHDDKAAIAQALREQLWPAFARGELRPNVHAVFPLAEAAEAHRLMESSQHLGKIMLQF